MSLDVSPDGKWIVFDMLGDIYTLPIEGGVAKRIHGGMSFESQPKFSPDGQWIAFLSDRSGAENVWVMKPDGTDAKAITKDTKAMFVSPDVDRRRQLHRGLKIRSVDRHVSSVHVSQGWRFGPEHRPGSAAASGTGTARARRPPRNNMMGVQASPDGKFIYWAQRTGAFDYNARFPLWQIMRFDRDTGETSRITNTQGSAMRPVLSPDGKNMVYATRYETKTALRVRNLESNTERWLINNVTRDDQESRATRDTFPGYDFMPDGRSLIVPINGKIAKVDFATGAATDVPFTVNVEAEIGPRVHFDYRVDDSCDGQCPADPLSGRFAGR